jgi:hypothetical protein
VYAIAPSLKMFDYLSTLIGWSVKSVAATKRNRDAKKDVRAENSDRQKQAEENNTQSILLVTRNARTAWPISSRRSFQTISDATMRRIIQSTSPVRVYPLPTTLRKLSAVHSLVVRNDKS